MLIAKLKEPVDKVYQGEGLETITVSAQYLCASTIDYDLGSENVIFYYKIGKIILDEDNKPSDFKRVISGHIKLNSNDLKDWGTDDFEGLKAIAKKLGVEIEETFKLDTDIPFRS